MGGLPPKGSSARRDRGRARRPPGCHLVGPRRLGRPPQKQHSKAASRSVSTGFRFGRPPILTASPRRASPNRRRSTHSMRHTERSARPTSCTVMSGRRAIAKPAHGGRPGHGGRSRASRRSRSRRETRQGQYPRACARFAWAILFGRSFPHPGVVKARTISHRFRTNTPSSDQFMSRWTEARRVPLTVVVQSGVACLASSRSASSLLRPLQH